MSLVNEFSGKRITVMGLGHFGGGLGAVTFLLARGARVTVTDLRSEVQLEDALAQFDPARLENLILGRHRDEDFTGAELIVVNPAVKQPGNRYLELASAAGVPLTSEMNLFWQRCRGKKIAITGSVGKSTTANLIHHCLLAAGEKARLGGNIGISLLPEVDEISEEEWIVLELSSFQLADLNRLQPQPEVSVVTNFFPNHLDWHESLDDYRQAKETIVRWQTPAQVAVLNADDAEIPLWSTAARVVWFGHEVWRDRPGVSIAENELTVRAAAGGGTISRESLAACLQTRQGLSHVAAAAGALTVGLGIPMDRYASALAEYRPLPHRLEQIAEIQGRTFINDSKATTPEATIAALTSLARPVLLIAGGKDKGVDLMEMARVIAQRAKGVALIGDTATSLEERIHAASLAPRAEPEATAREFGPAPAPVVFHAPSLDDAVRWAWQQSAAGDAVLLSPGCASHAEFANYERRGERFVECVKKLT